MPTPCFVSTCSVDLSFDPVFGLAADARLADTGSIDCIDRADPDLTDGLFVKVFGLLGDATSGIADAVVANQPRFGGYCGQSLKRTSVTGQLFAAPEGAQALNSASAGWTESQSTGAAGTIMPVAGTGGGAAHATPNVTRVRDDQFTNPFSCEAWCLFTMHEVKVIGNGIGAADGAAFYVVARAAVASISGDVLGADLLGGNNRMDHFGAWSGAGGANGQHKAQNIHALFRLEENGTVTVRTEIEIESTRRFDMTTGDDDGGVALQHPAAVFWRVDSHPLT